MTHSFEVAGKKDAPSRIPVICIDSNYCPDILTQESPPSGQKLSTFMSDGEFVPERGLSFRHQASQFVCWFNGLTPLKQFLFTTLSLQHISSEYLKLLHAVTTDRLSEEYQNINVAAKANDIAHLNNLDVMSDDFCATILDLLSSLSIPKERGADFSKIHDKYLSLVDKALENTTHQKPIFEDACDSLEGQLLITAMTTPLFTLDDRHWLQKNIKSRCEACTSWQSTGLLILANDLLEALELHKGNAEGFLASAESSLSRSFRSCSINSPYPFLPRSLYSYSNRRHHSLVPPASENSLIVPSLFASPHLLSSSSSPNSSGFVSGSESMYQGLNEPLAMSSRGNRLATPSNSRLYLLRRQSASPYTPQEGELKEEDDIAPATACSSALPEQNSSLCSFTVSTKSETSPTTASSEEVFRYSKDHLDPLSSPQESSNIPCLSAVNLPFKTSSTIGFVSNISSPNDCDDGNEVGFRPPSTSLSDPFGGHKTSRSRHKSVLIQDIQVEDPGMAQVPGWLKSLRLHKYIGLFKRLTYYQMLGITDEWLQRQHVTQGARNKILVSIANLNSRSATLANLEVRIETIIHNPSARWSNLRGCLSELRSILQTPFPPAVANRTASSPHCLSSTSSVEDSASATGAVGPNFGFSSDVEDYVDEGADDDDGGFMDFRTASGILCQCPCTNSDTCLFDRTNAPGDAHSPKRPKSSEGGVVTTNLFFPTVLADTLDKSPTVPDASEVVPKTEGLEGENLSEQIMRCLDHASKALLCDPIDDDNYGSFMQLLATVLEHSSFSQAQKDQVTVWQKQMVDYLGPAPPLPRRSCHHHHHHRRAASRRSSYHYTQSFDCGGPYSVPYTPRSSVGCSGFASRPYFASPVRLPYLHHQQQTHSSVPFAFSQASPGFNSGGGARWSSGMVRGRSAEPDIYQHHQGPSRPAFQEQTATLIATPQHRVASMDSLTISTPYGLTEPRVVSCLCCLMLKIPHIISHATNQFFVHNRMVSCHDPSGSDISTSVSPFASPELQSTGCFAFVPASDGSEEGNEGLTAAVAAAVAYLQPLPPPSHPPSHPPPLLSGIPNQRRWLTGTTVTAATTPASSAMADYSTAEINRNLELLTEKVTKLAIEGEFEFQCTNFKCQRLRKV
ncbi:unnamed protein product [Hydatigera taeniaeformis]|uniref:SAM domain-containing protein n=1 Tax=Hydatigena taeniaeformis TaxID=6205 RepID=A0A0R3WMF7_HYDTA|nr:unnamed protein product [Hydatigera taeniaeformis]